MIGIRVNGEFLELAEDYKINLQLINPLFSDGIGYNSQSFSFTIPGTGLNNRLLNYRQLPLLGRQDNEVACQVYLMGNYWQEGTLLFKQRPYRGDFSASLQIDLAPLAKLLKERDLNSFELGGDRVITTNTSDTGAQDMVDHANATTLGSVDTFDYVFFPVYNPNFYDGKHFAYDDVLINYETRYAGYYEPSGTFNNDVLELLASASITKILNLVPYPYLIYLLRTILAELNYSLEDTSWSIDGEIKSLVLYNNYSLDQAEEIDVNVFGNVDDLYFNTYQKTIRLSRHMPDATSFELFQGVIRAFNLMPDIKGRGLSLIAKNDLINQTGIDWKNKCLGYTLSFPDDQGYTFSSELDGDDARTGSSYLFDAEDFTVAGEVDTIADLPIANLGDVYYIRSLNAYYELFWDENLTPGPGATWRFYSYRYDEIVVGDGKTNIKSQISTTQVYWAKWDGNNYWRIPAVEQIGGSNLYGLGRNPFSLRLLFYRGMVQTDPANTLYPQASPDDINGTYSYSLYWHGVNGLYEKWHKPWNDLIRNSIPAVYNLQFDMTDLLSLDATKQVRLRTEAGEMDAFWEKIDIRIDRKGIESCRADVYLLDKR